MKLALLTQAALLFAVAAASVYAQEEFNENSDIHANTLPGIGDIAGLASMLPLLSSVPMVDSFLPFLSFIPGFKGIRPGSAPGWDPRLEIPIVSSEGCEVIGGVLHFLCGVFSNFNDCEKVAQFLPCMCRARNDASAEERCLRKLDLLPEEICQNQKL